MSARLSLVCLCALLLSLAEGLSRSAAAKPPELPANEPEDCAQVPAPQPKPKVNAGEQFGAVTAIVVGGWVVDPKTGLPPQSTFPPARVGQIHIRGNGRISPNVIRQLISLSPGQAYTESDLRAAERNLARIGIFEDNPRTGVRPTVVVINRGERGVSWATNFDWAYPSNCSGFDDILVTVQEKPLNLTFGIGIQSDAGRRAPIEILQSGSEEEIRFLLLTLQEAQTGSLTAGIGINSDAGLHGSIQLNERNFDLEQPAPALPIFKFPASLRGERQFLQCVLFGMSPALAILPVAELFDAEEVTESPFPLYHSRPEKGGLYISCNQFKYYAQSTPPVSGMPAGCCPCKGVEEMLAESHPNPSAVEYTCPYLQQKAAEKKAPAAAPTEQLGDALGNLEKLGEARKAYRQATYYRHHGDPGMALYRYDMVRRLCPGSRYDRMATKHVEQLKAQMCNTQSVDHAEEAEPKSEGQPTNPEDQSRAREPSFEEQVAAMLEIKVTELLEQSQLAYAEGCFDAAQDLAKQALALDPDSVAANALVYKMHLLIELREKSKPESGCKAQPSMTEEMRSCKVAELMHKYNACFREAKFTEAEKYARLAHAVDPDNPVVAAALNVIPRMPRRQIEQALSPLQPVLPPVDPELVDGLEKVLLEVEEPNAAGLEIIPEESIGGEEQESSPAGEPLDLGALLQDAANAVSTGGCAEVDNSRPEGTRMRFQGQVAGLWIEVQSNGDGHGSFTVGLPLFPFPTEDLRAAQRVHNERVLHWIEAVSSGEEGCENGQEE